MTRGLRTIGLVVGILGMAAAVSSAEPSKAIREAIKNLQKAKNFEDRVEAARYLGGFDDPAAVQALADALSDRDPEVQEAAASALWHTGEKAVAAKPALLRAIDGSPPRVVARAAGALETMGVSAKDLADARRTVLKRRPDETTAFLAARGLIGLDPAATVLPPLLDYLDTTTRAAAGPDHDSDDRDNQESAEKALLELAETNDRSAIGPLRTALDGMPQAAPSLLPVLAAFKPPPDHFAQTLVKAMDSRSPEVRATAVRLCRGLTADADVEVWGLPAANLTRDRDETVRSWAVSALETAGARAAAGAPDLVRLLKSDPSAEIRKGAAKALEAMGDASQAVPQKTKVQVADAAKEALIAAAHDKDKDLAEAALNAYNVLYLPTSESVEALMRIAEASGPAPIRQRALTLLGRRQGQAKAVLERIRPLTQSADLATEAKEAFDWIQRGGPGSPNPLVGGSTAPRVASSTPAAAAAAPASTAGKPDPAAEARGLATLRRLSIEFDEAQFNRVVREANLEAVRAFLDAGMPANHRFANDVGRTPLLVFFFGSACTANEPTPEPARDVVKTLIAAGADVNLADDHKNTPLMWAAEKCDRATIRLLLAAGAKIDVRNQSNMNALEGSVFSGNSGVEELIAAGARLDAQKAKDYLEAYKDDPKAVALIRKAAVK